ncbi:MAG: Bro-N domain-containing protein [Alphaproteobacteria bacterium]|nr:Bro-N domain-containing protein [Alphaproteobacteria bacterium]
MNQIQAFNFNSNEIRVVRGEGGEPWFVAKDVADVLSLGNSNSSVALLDDDEKGIHTVETLGGNQEMTVVNESGLYSLILRSRKPEAKKFKKWVTSEVLPSIRKHGAYMTPATIDEIADNPDLLIQLATKLKHEREHNALLIQQRDEAIRTKAWIGTRREATAMATASIEKRRAEVLAIEKEVLAVEREALAEQLGDSTNWKSVKSLHWLLNFFADSKGMWSAVGKKLKTISDEMGYDVRQIEHSDYGYVNAYHLDVIDRFRARVIADPNMLGKYRRMEESA